VSEIRGLDLPESLLRVILAGAGATESDPLGELEMRIQQAISPIPY